MSENIGEINEETLEDTGLSGKSDVDMKSQAVEDIDKEVKELLRAKNIKSAKEKLNTALDNDNLSEEEKAMLSIRLITVSIMEKNRKKARDIANDILKNKNISEKTKVRVKAKMLEVELSSKHYKDAIKLRNQLRPVLDSGMLEEKGNRDLKVNSIILAIKEENYEEAKDLLQSILIDKKSSAYVVAAELLMKTMMLEGNYETANDFAQKMLSDVEIGEKGRTIITKYMMQVAALQYNMKEVEKLAKSILDNDEIGEKSKGIIVENLYVIRRDYVNSNIAVEQRCRLDLERIRDLTGLGDYKKAKEIGNEIINNKEASDDAKAKTVGKLIQIARLENDYKTVDSLIEILKTYQVSEYVSEKILKQVKIANRCKKKYEKKQAKKDEVEQQGDEIVNLNDEDTNLLEQSAIYKEHYKYTREKLYAGEIQLDDLKEISEKNSKTLQGCLFVAEVYKYFKAEELGIKWLTGYKKKNPDMPETDKKAIAGAMDILNTKRQAATGMLQKQWNDVYTRLQSKAVIEAPSSHSDDEDGGYR